MVPGEGAGMEQARRRGIDPKAEDERMRRKMRLSRKI